MIRQSDLLRALALARENPRISAEKVVHDLLVESLRPSARAAYIYISNMGWPVSVAEIGDYLGLKQNNVSNIMRSLLKLELVSIRGESKYWTRESLIEVSPRT